MLNLSLSFCGLRAEFLSPLRGLFEDITFTNGLRRGLYSFAASRLTLSQTLS